MQTQLLPFWWKRARAEVRAGFGDGFKDEDDRAGRALGPSGKQGMARQDGWKGDRRLKGQTKDSGEREKGFELKISTRHSCCPRQKDHSHSQKLNIVNKTSKNNIKNRNNNNNYSKIEAE